MLDSRWSEQAAEPSSHGFGAVLQPYHLHILLLTYTPIHIYLVALDTVTLCTHAIDILIGDIPTTGGLSVPENGFICGVNRFGFFQFQY